MSSLNTTLANAYTVLKDLAPGFDPLRDHRNSDKVLGSSRFRAGIISVEDVLTLVANSSLYEMVPGFGGAVVFVFAADDTVGKATHTEVKNDEDYELRLYHGCLQPFGDVEEAGEETKFFSVVCTPEQTKDGLRFALASAYPGKPDKVTEEDRSGLTEGQRLSAAEVRRRGLRPKQA